MDEPLSLPQFLLFAKVMVTIYLVVSLVGWFGNGMIIYVTIRSKNLRNSCNILIAAQAASDILITAGHIPFAYFSYTHTLVSFFTCWKIDFIFASAMDFSNWLLFFVAMDRLIAGKFPQKYRAMERRYYVGGILASCFVYCGIIKYITYQSLTNELTLCAITSGITGVTEVIWFGGQTLINFCVLVTYVSVRSVLKRATSARENAIINRSLNTIILINLCGCFLAYCGCTVMFLVCPSHRVFEMFEFILGVFGNMNFAAPFFIYYSRSTLYRKEFRRVLFGFRRYKTEPTVSATHQSVTVR